jgi:hypothetical protein
MHQRPCNCKHCPQCQSRAYQFGAPARPAYSLARFSPSQEMELAMELLGVSSEAEMDHFLGGLFKKVWGGIKKVGSFVGKIAKPLGGVLKTLAKKALPFVGGALGSLIPIPGVGTMVGKALGTAVSNALEMEFAQLEMEDRELEMARRFVRIAHSAASQLASLAPSANPLPAIEQAVVTAARRHVPRLDLRPIQRGAASIGSGGFGFSNSRATSGGWSRQGGNIVLELG